MQIEFYISLLFVASFFLTYILKIYAIEKEMIDIPNSRSSHVMPTPRGGGMAIVASFLIGLLVLASYELIIFQTFFMLFISGTLVALVGWLDDHGHVSARWRLLVHFSVSSFVVFANGGLPVLSFFGWDVNFGVFGHFLSIIALVWMLNLYNFMDGIDGLAGGQAVISTVTIGAILFFVFNQQSFANLHWLLAACCLGFLLWNFPIAKIFMGDAGSGFIGIMLGSLLLITSHVDQSLFWAWLIMLGVFIVDATYTLLKRFFRGDKVHDAHCSHAYQYASRKFKSHKTVTLSVYIINIVWLAPIAVCVSMYKIDGLTGLTLAYTPLLLLTYFFKAGCTEGETNPL